MTVPVKNRSGCTSVVILGNGAAGAEKQAVALAEALGLPYKTVRLVPSRAAMLLPLRAQLALQAVFGPKALGIEVLSPPFPLLAISCGRASVPASVALREGSTGATATVHVQRPLCDASYFDAVVAPRHDYRPHAVLPPSVVLTDGALSGVGAAALEQARARWETRALALPRPRIGMLIGGPVARRWWQRPLAPALDPVSAASLVRSAASAASASGGGSLILSASRRTPADATAVMSAELETARSRGLGVWQWRGEEDGPNPYLGMLAWSDYIIVTPDSVSMASEAVSAAKPVYISSVDGCRGRFAAFHSAMLASGRVRWWPGGAALEAPELWSGLRGGPAEAAVAAQTADGCAVAPSEGDTLRAARRVAQLLLARAALGWSELNPPTEARLRAVAKTGARRRDEAAGARSSAGTRRELPAPLPLSVYLALSEVCAPLLAAASAAKAGRPRVFAQALALSHGEAGASLWAGGGGGSSGGGAGGGPPSDARYTLWVHGASVGETLSSLPLVRALLLADSSAHVLITASTEAALRRLALERLGPRVVLRPRPVDAPSVLRRFLAHWRPSALVLLESELWPALLTEAQAASLPVALLNGRLSPSTARRWLSSASLHATLAALLGSFDVILAQSPPMADVLRALADDDAAAPAWVGDLKQLRGGAAPTVAQLEALRRDLGAPRSLWLAASTHAGEEEAALDAHALLRKAHPRLLLLLAPRHPERGARVAALANARGWVTAQR